MGQREEEWPAIGIDLGTTNSSVGIWEHGRIKIITNELGSRTTPSMVAFTDYVRLIGEAAENQSRMNPTNTIFDVKRLIGRRFYDEMVQDDMKLWPFKVIPGPFTFEEEKPLVEVTYNGKSTEFSPEEISAMVLMKMKHIAEAYLNKSVTNAVVTVPAYFNDSQRQATKDAGRIAGLNVLRIINEPTAAAIAYCFDKKLLDCNASRKNILVFDLGGGTFDVSLVSIQKDLIEVKAVDGDAHLGGSDFDNRMVMHFSEEFKRKHNKDVSQNPQALGRLRAACEEAKRELSMTAQTSIELFCLHDDVDFSSTISRDLFDNLNIELFRKCIVLVEKCLKDGHIDKSDVDDVILVGGSTRIIKVRQLLKEFFDGKELSRSINPDEAVAYGAAVHAGILCGITNDNSMVLVDVTPLSLGVEVGNGNMSIVIPRNTTIPTKKERTYGVSHNKEQMYGDKDSQAFVLKIDVYEGEERIAQDNNFLGVFELSGVSPSDVSSSSINVCFEIDINGILSVSAEDMSNCNKSEIKTINRSRLTKTEVDRMLNDAEEYNDQDKKYMKMVNAKNTLENYANDMWDKLTDCGQTVTDEDKKTIMDGIQHIRSWLHSNSKQVFSTAKYEEKLEELKQICTPFISMMC